ncbi:MAG: aldo/keto reductase [Bacteroidales bacterium]|nr:aldo/keto reductase [Bacteroidales bacterium]
MKEVKLNNGVMMPQVGYGVFQVSPQECERCVSDAIKVGYRMIDTAILEQIGKKYGKSVAQTALKYLLQKDVIIIPKSTHIERMQQNLDLFDFELSKDDMEIISSLDEKHSLVIGSHQNPEVVKFFMSILK